MESDTKNTHKSLDGEVILENSSRVVSSIACLVSFLVYGASCSALGPALPYLADQMDVSTSAMGVAFTTRGVGYTVGTLASAYCMTFSDRYVSKDVVNCIGLCIPGISVGIVGNTSIYSLSMVCFFLQGMGFGVMDTYANCAFPEIWGKEAQPWMQALHTCFGVGAIVGPVIVGACGLMPAFNAFFVLSFLPLAALQVFRFLFQKKVNNAQYSECDQHISKVELISIKSEVTMPADAVVDDSVTLEEATDHDLNLHTEAIIPNPSTAITTTCIEEESKEADTLAEKEEESAVETASPPLLIRSLITMFLFLYVGYIVGYAGWIPSYALDSEVTSSYSDAAYITSYFYITLTVGRFLSILGSMYLSKTMLMTIELTIMLCAAILGMIILSMNYAATATVTALMALSLCAIYPIMLTIVDDFDYRVNAADMKVYIVGGTLGEAIIPIFYGIVLEQFGYYSFSVFSLSITLSMCILFAMFYIFASTHKKKAATLITADITL